MFSRFFKKKKTEENKPPFDMPIGLRINGLVRLNPSFETYFLLNQSKLGTILPEDMECIIQAISHFFIFGVDVYRASLNSSPPSVLKINVKSGEIADIIFFNRSHKFEVSVGTADYNSWIEAIGYKDIKTPNGVEYFRDWMGDVERYGDQVKPIMFSEKFCESNNRAESSLSTQAMLYSRILDDVDIEYLLTSLVSSFDPRGNPQHVVEIWIGTVINQTYFEVF